VRLLPGLSGAQVYLMTRDGVHWFVRKTAENAAGNERLRGQALRQHLLAERLAPAVLSTPRILLESERDGRYFFDMELVRGTDAASYLRRASYPEVVAFTKRLREYIGAAAAAPALREPARPPAALSLEHMGRIQQSTGAVSDRVSSRLHAALEALRSDLTRPSTLCHGDLTLENLIVRDDGALCAVDLLDGPVEHYWQDAAKLHQDLDGEWYRRGQPAIAPGVLAFVSCRLRETCRALDPAYDRVHAFLVAFQFLRILPYVRTDAARAFVLERLDHFTRRAAGEHPNGGDA
jgi:aminoglycoside phosphotransferase